jgi:hypothetical protein
MGPRFAIDRPEDGLAEWRSYYEGLSVGVLSEADQPPRDQARFTREPPRPGGRHICRICGGSVDEIMNPDRPGCLTIRGRLWRDSGRPVDMSARTGPTQSQIARTRSRPHC